jgi:iron(III) transport system permease protein
VFLIVQGALAAADPYIEESATIMGASRWHILRTITFPLVIPSIASGALIVFIRSLGNVGVPAVLGGDYYVLPTLILFQVEGSSTSTARRPSPWSTCCWWCCSCC